jgi:hypothetical protein
MKLRHAAALALVGWYLMTPPWVGFETFDWSAPLSKWYEAEQFKTAAECQNYREHVSAKDLTEKKAVPAGHSADANAEVYRHGQCVADDDPRLEGGT